MISFGMLIMHRYIFYFSRFYFSRYVCVKPPLIITQSDKKGVVAFIFEKKRCPGQPAELKTTLTNFQFQLPPLHLTPRRQLSTHWVHMKIYSGWAMITTSKILVPKSTATFNSTALVVYLSDSTMKQSEPWEGKCPSLFRMKIPHFQWRQ